MNLRELNLLSLAIRENQDMSEVLVPGTYRGVKVYQNNYLYGHIQALANKYTSVFRFLGKENFNYFSKKFIEKKFPEKENIDEYGDRFFSFLAQEKELSHFSYLPYIGELDLFWFNIYENINNKKKFPKGTFSLWTAIVNENEIKKIEIVENKMETIMAMNNESNDDVFLALIV